MRFIDHISKVTVETEQHKLTKAQQRMIRAAANQK